MSMQETQKKQQAPTQGPRSGGSFRGAGGRGGNNDRNKPRRGDRGNREVPEFDSRTLEIARVARVMAGGKRMRFRALIVLGDRKGGIGYAVAKGADVSLAVGKATNAAKKKMVRIKITKKGTIPHEITVKYKSAKLMLRPAVEGTGIIAGGAVRTVLELSGVQNVVGKVYGSGNKINNVKAAIKALTSMK